MSKNQYFTSNSIHTFKKKDKYFLFCSHNLSSFEITSSAYEVLHSNNIDNNSEILTELLKWGLFPVKQAKTDKVKKKSPLNGVNENLIGLYLVISQNCNLRCKYCSAGFGGFGMNPKAKFMSEEIALRAIDFYFKNLSKDTKSPCIFFDGGEPILNFNVLKSCVEYARKVKPNTYFSLITNGTLIDEPKAKWLAENNIGVTFSIDGTKEIHNQNRVYKNGKGSYDNAEKGLKAFRKYAKNVMVVKASIPKATNYMECVHNLWNLGVSTVVANSTVESNFVSSEQFNMNKKEFTDFINNWEILCEEITDNLIKFGNSPFIHLFRFYLDSITRRRKVPRSCEIGRSLSITPDGSIYVCKALVGFEEYKIGDIFKGINYNFDKLNETYEKYYHKCDDCWARNLCGTRCMAQSIKYKELDDKFPASRLCEFNKKAIETVIYMYYRIKEERPEILSHGFPPF